MRTLKVKLEATPEQAQALLKTMHQFNAACNFVAEKAFELHTANQKPHPEGWGMRGMRQDVRPDFLDFRNRLVVVAQTPLICVIETPFSVFPEIH